ncbi:GlsB/YeaQ/YmgE family stress response membrane protein [Paenibacillus silviterrae]|uniref:GlsB/YeaQ/YmgE family stress response membrane protein n=1 Tax=Paenibacillus silviterrae TaxID=3242194 RepID=UPI002542CEA8|nr:GlsB/YeaQ/YmgE family stress response membrane protein [Paenibacillus chinjuensis]
MMSLLITLLMAMVIGTVGSAVAPGTMPGGILGAMLAGFVGAWIGYWLLGSWGPVIAGFAVIPSVLGAALFTLLLGLISRGSANRRA